jgi:hypothetical protein
MSGFIDFEARELARRTDPSSSHDAAQEMVESGALNAQCRIVYAALVSYPNHTSAEIAKLASLDRYMVARRLPDLAKRRLVYRGKKRRCQAKGSLAVEWCLR